MENKYYIPSIEEFHVGFETELYHGDVGQWGKYVWKLDDTAYEFRECIDEECIRVKYLDKEDIESLGFELEQDLQDDYDFEWHIVDINGDRIGKFSDGMEDNIEFFDTFFRIKNKSELVKMLKMLGIEA
jgi:hypothetical protein